MKWSKLKDLRNSIIRRSLVLSFIVIPAYFVNFLFLVVSERILEIQSFGIFYTALSLVNILIGPAVVLNLFFSRRITTGLSLIGPEVAICEFRLYVRYVLYWGGILGLAVLVIMTAFGYLWGVKSTILVFLICLTAYGIYVAETTRAAFQGFKRFIALGVETLLWTMLRFILGFLGILLIGSPWAGLLGIFLASVIIFSACYYVLTKPSEGKVLSTQQIEYRESESITFFCLSYGLFVFIMYVDIIVGYIGLDRYSLGIYSTSCILGKSIILFTNPIVNVMFPVMVEQDTNRGIDNISVLKSGVITLLISGFMALFIISFTDFVCSTVLRLSEYNGSVIRAVVSSAIPLSLLRILVILQLAKKLNKPVFFLFPILILNIIVLYYFRNNLVQFSWSFTILCYLGFVYYLILCTPRERISSLISRPASK
jgi:O-antigen/teichoic acid export membrane protein